MIQPLVNHFNGDMAVFFALGWFLCMAVHMFIYRPWKRR